MKRVSTVSKPLVKRESTEGTSRSPRVIGDRKENNQQLKQLNTSDRKENKQQLKQPNTNGNRRKLETSLKGSAVTRSTHEQKFDNVKVTSKATSESSEGISEKIVEDKAIEDFKEIDISDEAPSNCDQSVGTDNETADTEENNLEEKLNPYQKIDEMETIIVKLEEELREVAALEISLYSVAPEHVSSPYKVHAPARRLSRLYVYACKHWSWDKRATIAKNTVSGLVFITKSCGSDVARLTFWLSNVIVLREIISQTLGSSFSGSCTIANGVFHESNGITSSQKQDHYHSGHKSLEGLISFEGIEDWQEARTFKDALERIESLIFERVVEYVWKKTFTPHMLSPVEELCKNKNFGKFSELALGSWQQGEFSMNLWKDVFFDAFTRLCPVRAGGSECGCLPILARMVMKQCIKRLDVAMFNAILCESASQISTDPVSDPIADARTLPVPAGDLSFGSGVHLKNAIGYWSRCFSDLFGVDANDAVKEDKAGDEEIGIHSRDAESKPFFLLNSLSDLLVLPKDLIVYTSIRKEVCPFITLPLITRILCNFTPDEFCPDPVPCAVLEDLNKESLQTWSEVSFPYRIAPIEYSPPSDPGIVQKAAADSDNMVESWKNSSIYQKGGYTSDEDFDDPNMSFSSILDRHPANRNGSLKRGVSANVRFQLLHDVWST